MTDCVPPDLHSHIYKTNEQKCYFSKKLWAVVSGCRNHKLIVPEHKCQVCLWNLQLHSEPLWDCPTPTLVTPGLPHHHQIRPPGTHCPCLGSWVLWGLCLSPLTLAPGLGALRRCSPGRQSHRQPATGWLPRLPFFPAWSLFPSDCRTPHQAASFPSPM